jgi:hypothetical protein
MNASEFVIKELKASGGKHGTAFFTSSEQRVRTNSGSFEQLAIRLADRHVSDRTLKALRPKLTKLVNTAHVDFVTAKGNSKVLFVEDANGKKELAVRNAKGEIKAFSEASLSDLRAEYKLRTKEILGTETKFSDVITQITAFSEILDGKSDISELENTAQRVMTLTGCTIPYRDSDDVVSQDVREIITHLIQLWRDNRNNAFSALFDAKVTLASKLKAKAKPSKAKPKTGGALLDVVLENTGNQSAA